MPPEDEVSLRDTINAVVEQAETEDPPVSGSEGSDTAPAAPLPAATPPPAAPPAGEVAAPGSEETSSTPPTQPVKEDTQSAKRKEGVPATPPAPGQFERPPVAWKLPVREKHWKSLPVEVREEVVRREREIVKGLSESADARKFAQKFGETIRPYEHLMRLESDDPLVGFQSYLKTATILRTGTAAEKARSLASVIQQFGVDPSMLDQALVSVFNGQPAPQDPQGQQQFRDPRVDDLLKQVESSRDVQMRQIEEAAESEIDAFANSGQGEFLDEVRDLMSDILSLAAKRNQRMDLQTAYKRATILHPEVSKILEERAGNSRVQEQAKAAAAARRKAISGGGPPPPSGVNPATNGTVRGDIEAAISALEGSR